MTPALTTTIAELGPSDEQLEAIARAIHAAKNAPETYAWWHVDPNHCRLSLTLARAAISALKAGREDLEGRAVPVLSDGWQTIETAPRESRIQILCYCAHSDGYFIAHWNSGDWWEQRTGKTAPEFTHWMPLPPAPRTARHTETPTVEEPTEEVLAIAGNAFLKAYNDGAQEFGNNRKIKAMRAAWSAMKEGR